MVKPEFMPGVPANQHVQQDCSNVTSLCISVYCGVVFVFHFNLTRRGSSLAAAAHCCEVTTSFAEDVSFVLMCRPWASVPCTAS